jgi:ribonucleoside-diphosphate reductase alpha chain
VTYFSALWIQTILCEQLKQIQIGTYFLSNDIKIAGLKPFYEIYGTEYEEEYNKAVELGIGTKIKTHDLWLKIIESQIETGMPYIL